MMGMKIIYIFTKELRYIYYTEYDFFFITKPRKKKQYFIMLISWCTPIHAGSDAEPQKATNFTWDLQLVYRHVCIFQRECVKLEGTKINNNTMFFFSTLDMEIILKNLLHALAVLVFVYFKMNWTMNSCRIFSLNREPFSYLQVRLLCISTYFDSRYFKM